MITKRQEEIMMYKEKLEEFRVKEIQLLEEAFEKENIYNKNFRRSTEYKSFNLFVDLTITLCNVMIHNSKLYRFCGRVYAFFIDLAIMCYAKKLKKRKTKDEYLPYKEFYELCNEDIDAMFMATAHIEYVNRTY